VQSLLVYGHSCSSIFESKQPRKIFTFFKIFTPIKTNFFQICIHFYVGVCLPCLIFFLLMLILHNLKMFKHFFIAVNIYTQCTTIIRLLKMFSYFYLKKKAFEQEIVDTKLCTKQNHIKLTKCKVCQKHTGYKTV
jgi:hypothetical protein